MDETLRGRRERQMPGRAQRANQLCQVARPMEQNDPPNGSQQMDIFREPGLSKADRPQGRRPSCPNQEHARARPRQRQPRRGHLLQRRQRHRARQHSRHVGMPDGAIRQRDPITNRTHVLRLWSKSPQANSVASQAGLGVDGAQFAWHDADTGAGPLRRRDRVGPGLRRSVARQESRKPLGRRMWSH